MFGGDIPQLYIVFPAASGEPPRLLRDFERLHINPGETRGVSFELSPYDVSIWDVVAQDWVIPDGEFKAIIAHHSFDDTGVLETFWPGKC